MINDPRQVIRSNRQLLYSLNTDVKYLYQTERWKRLIIKPSSIFKCSNPNTSLIRLELRQIVADRKTTVSHMLKLILYKADIV